MHRLLAILIVVFLESSAAAQQMVPGPAPSLLELDAIWGSSAGYVSKEFGVWGEITSLLNLSGGQVVEIGTAVEYPPQCNVAPPATEFRNCRRHIGLVIRGSAGQEVTSRFLAFPSAFWDTDVIDAVIQPIAGGSRIVILVLARFQWSSPNPNDWTFAYYLVGLTTAGNVDPAFDWKIVRMDPTSSFEYITSLEALPDGRFVVAGDIQHITGDTSCINPCTPPAICSNSSCIPNPCGSSCSVTQYCDFSGAPVCRPNNEMAAATILANGTATQTLQRPFNTGSFVSNGLDLVVRPGSYDVRLAGALSNNNPLAGNNDFVVVAYGTTSFTLATTYGTNGKVIINLGGNESLNSITVDASKRVVGLVHNDDKIIRLTTSGARDGTFGSNGVVQRTNVWFYPGANLTTLSDNRVLVTTTGIPLPPLDADGVYIELYNTNGTFASGTFTEYFVSNTRYPLWEGDGQSRWDGPEGQNFKGGDPILVHTGQNRVLVGGGFQPTGALPFYDFVTLGYRLQ